MESRALSSNSQGKGVGSRLVLNQEDDQSVFLLKNLLNKTQTMLTTAQTALETERSVHQTQLQTQERTLLTQLSSYREENRLLRSELERLESGTKSTDFSLRKAFFTRLESVESEARKEEGELKGQIEFLTEEMEAARTELANNREREGQEKRGFRSELNAAKRENAYLGGQLEKSLGSLKSKVHKTAAQLLKRAELAKNDRNVYAQKLNLLLRHSNESEELWLREKQQLVSNLSTASKLQSEKEANFAFQLSLIQAEKDRTISEYREEVELLRKEKETYSTAFQESFQSCTDREIALEKEIVRLQNGLVRVISMNQAREEKLQTDLGMLGHEFKSIEEHRGSYEGFNAEFSLALEKYRVLINDFHSNNAEIEQKDEVTRLKERLENKENELISMRELYVTARQGERKRVSKTVTSLKFVTDELQRSQGKMIEDGLTAIQLLRKSVESSVDSLPEVVETYHSAVSQLQESRSEVRKLKTDLKGMELELVQAQKVISSYMDTIQQYEQAFFITDQKAVFETQMQALQRELDMLRDAKITQMRVYSEEIEKTRTELVQKDEKLQEISLELVKLRSLTNLKSSEASKPLLQKFDLLLKLGKSLESALTALKLGSKQREEMNSFQCEMEVQELQLLRAAAKDSDETYEQLKAGWKRENNALEADISALKQTLSSNENRLLGIVKEQHNLIEIQNRRIQELGQVTVPEVQIHTESSTPELTKTLKTEAEALRIQLENAGTSHIHEIETWKSLYEKGEMNRKLIVDSLSTTLRIKTESLNRLSYALGREKDLHQKETQMMREELTKLRSHCYERYELLQSERKGVIEELKTLLEMAGEKEGTDRKTFYDAIKKMKTILDSSSADRKGGSGLQQLQDELTALKTFEKERGKQQSIERDSFNALISKLNDSIASVTRSAAAEKEDHMLETRILKGTIEELQKECQILQQEREDWQLQTGTQVAQPATLLSITQKDVFSQDIPKVPSQ